MLRCIQTIIGVILTSFYFFPFEFSFLPSVNTKMAMAGFGLVLLGMNLGRSRDSVFNRDIVVASLIAVAVSFVGYLSTVYNNTIDYAYASYIVSMWVWLSAAYVVVSYMRYVYGRINCQLICDYLIVVCVFQCLVAVLMEYIPVLKQFVDSFLAGTGFMGKHESRLYGIGASLDVAGSRFAVALIMIAFMCSNVERYVKTTTRLILYLIAFVVILVAGNMIARTTTVGAVIAIVLFVFFRKENTQHSSVRLWPWLLGVVLFSVLVFCFLYNTNEIMYNNIRFAFEGFFSLVEEGHWVIRSNTQLLSHWESLPTNFKTWAIGDGYFEGHSVDPYFIGSTAFGYYGDTDVGYLRFIYYFGVLGLGAFIAFLSYVTYACCRNNPKEKILFILILIVNFVVWAKVSTDIFLVFALFLALGAEAKEEDNQLLIQNE